MHRAGAGKEGVVRLEDDGIEPHATLSCPVWVFSASPFGMSDRCSLPTVSSRKQSVPTAHATCHPRSGGCCPDWGADRPSGGISSAVSLASASHPPSHPILTPPLAFSLASTCSHSRSHPCILPQKSTLVATLASTLAATLASSVTFTLASSLASSLVVPLAFICIISLHTNMQIRVPLVVS